MHRSFLPSPLGKEDAALSSRCRVQNHCFFFSFFCYFVGLFLVLLAWKPIHWYQREWNEVHSFWTLTWCFFSSILLRFTSKLISRASWSELCNSWCRLVLVLKLLRIPFENFNIHKQFKYLIWDSILKPMKIRFNCLSN